MLFNSYIFILMFLPLTLAGYWLLRRGGHWGLAQTWLLTMSVVFYAYWDWRYVGLLAGLASFNYLVGGRLAQGRSRALLLFGLLTNLGVLAYFKYANFFLDTMSAILDRAPVQLNIILPLGISFFTFQKIAYLVECYRGEVKERDFGRFLLFVFFFPQLIAGPIVHFKQIDPQLRSLRTGQSVNASWIARGMFLFAVGLFKKVVIADYLAKFVDPAFAATATQTLLEAWTACLAYAFQLYYDFSGYCDMAIGLGLLFGIQLPQNFSQPYRAKNIADFWRRWHMTLGAFLRTYLYIPLGGNKQGFARMLAASFVVMVIGGLWHGAGWTFIVWGVLHGTYLVVYRVWGKIGFRLPANVSLMLTFLAVIVAWVPFRAATMHDTFNVWKAMLGWQGVCVPVWLAQLGLAVNYPVMNFPTIKGFELIFLLLLVATVWWEKNLHVFKDGFSRSVGYLAAFWALSLAGLVMLGQPSSFMYFQF